MKKKKYVKPKLTERALNKFFFACQCSGGHGSAAGCTSSYSGKTCPTKAPEVSWPFRVR